MSARSNAPRVAARIAAALLCLLCAACVFGAYRLTHLLDSQREYERWRGEGDMRFGQVSCFMPVDEKISLEQIYAFRNDMQKKLQEAAINDASAKPFNDAWATFGKVRVSGSHGSGDVYATAVGGSFFDFHPLTLISGSYFGDNDLMHDRVLLDEETAWLLFGGRELSGMELQINGRPFVVSGVIRREQDKISLSAYTGGMGIYMSYEAYMRLNEDAADTSYPGFMAEKGLDCYELVMAEPVRNYTYSVVSEKFPVGGGMLVNNAERYTLSNIFRLMRGFGSRSMQKQGVLLPYWENAARGTEDRCMLLVLCALLSGVYPLLLLIRLVFSFGRRGRDKLSGELLPSAKERLAERIRVRQRRRWEKKHPGWE